MGKFLQKVSHQDSILTKKKSQEFRGEESGENHCFLYRGRQNVKITMNQLFFGSVGSIGCGNDRKHHIMPGGPGFQIFISIRKKVMSDFIHLRPTRSHF